MLEVKNDSTLAFPCCRCRCGCCCCCCCCCRLPPSHWSGDWDYQNQTTPPSWIDLPEALGLSFPCTGATKSHGQQIHKEVEDRLESSSPYSEDHSSCSQEHMDSDINKISDRVQLILVQLHHSDYIIERQGQRRWRRPQPQPQQKTAAARKDHERSIRSRKFHRISCFLWLAAVMAESCLTSTLGAS